MKNSVILYANGTSENHGCEAIALSTINMIKDKIDTIYCTTTNIKYEKKLGSIQKISEKCELVEYYYYRKKSFANLFIAKMQRVLFSKNTFFENKPWLKNVKKVMKICDVALSVGGDNYCNRDLEWLYQSHNDAIDAGCKTVLWGASVDNNCLVDNNLKDDLEKFDLIIARESLSYDNLIKINVHTKLYPDPAFCLRKTEIEWPKNFKDKKVVGINFSPTILGFETSSGLLQKNYDNLLEYLITNTNYSIALIPHVIFNEKYCDYEMLFPYFEKYKKTKRVYMVEDCSCTELKGYISKCSILVTARTHASIAGYSECVPTLVVGYSIKAKGIAKDLFGQYKNYVIDSNSIKEETELINAFKWVDENQESIRKKLKKDIPEYCERAEKAKYEIFNLLRK